MFVLKKSGWHMSAMRSRDGAVVRALASHQCGLCSILARCYMWVEFVVGSRLAPRVTPGSPGYRARMKSS